MKKLLTEKQRNKILSSNHRYWIWRYADEVVEELEDDVILIKSKNERIEKLENERKQLKEKLNMLENENTFLKKELKSIMFIGEKNASTKNK